MAQCDHKRLTELFESGNVVVFFYCTAIGLLAKNNIDYGTYAFQSRTTKRAIVFKNRKKEREKNSIDLVMNDYANTERCRMKRKRGTCARLHQCMGSKFGKQHVKLQY